MTFQRRMFSLGSLGEVRFRLRSKGQVLLNVLRSVSDVAVVHAPIPCIALPSIIWTIAGYKLGPPRRPLIFGSVELDVWRVGCTMTHCVIRESTRVFQPMQYRDPITSLQNEVPTHQLMVSCEAQRGKSNICSGIRKRERWSQFFVTVVCVCTVPLGRGAARNMLYCYTSCEVQRCVSYCYAG